EFCEAARYMNLTKTEKNMISAKTKQRWDYYSVLETAKEMGEEKGRAIGEEKGAHEKAVTVATKLKNKGASLEEIQELTELSIDEIKKL
ncbi:MAG TPA: hypothetical protein VK541_05985, partial [Pedobacter sp.]|uniref:hypothetical protein n=1 Tax=Pedobacter sp. TaxID=1411316 RepID=UPI002B5884A2|nr:hypothetical protein [Pedobacter sp.]